MEILLSVSLNTFLENFETNTIESVREFTFLLHFSEKLLDITTNIDSKINDKFLGYFQLDELNVE